MASFQIFTEYEENKEDKMKLNWSQWNWQTAVGKGKYSLHYCSVAKWNDWIFDPIKITNHKNSLFFS
jgi:hypothetical protein